MLSTTHHPEVHLDKDWKSMQEETEMQIWVLEAQAKTWNNSQHHQVLNWLKIWMDMAFSGL